LMIAENAVKEVQLDKVLFIPCSSPPHKEAPDLVTAEHRVEMVKRSIKENPKFELCDFEVKKGGRSYTVDTVTHLRKTFPKDQIFVIVGSDIFRDVGEWKSFESLVGLCEFLVIERPGASLELPPPSVSRDQLNLLKYVVFKGPTVSVSSSEVREMLRKGKNVSHLVPPPAYDYIRAHHLYQTLS
jgi:nicotinate-nucleotide adenylyltransferase